MRPPGGAALQRAFPGVLAAWLTKQDDDTGLDVVLWRSREEAEYAASRIDALPEAKAWFRYISHSMGVRHADVAHEQLFALQHRSAGAGGG
jgi:hypothetical protein